MPKETKPTGLVETPLLDFALNDAGGKDSHKLRLWVLDAGQRAAVADRRDFYFSAGKTASLIYEEQHHGHYATEVPVFNESTWKWIAKWMERGFLAEGYMLPQNSKHWELTGGKIVSRDIH